MPNIKLIMGGLAVVILLATHWFTYRAGVNKERADDAAAIANYQKQVSKLIDKLDIEKAKQKVVVHEKIVKIKQAKSICADTNIYESIFSQLQ
jgi:hypothetical protein